MTKPDPAQEAQQGLMADHLSRRLAARRGLSRAVIFFERFWLAAWPVLGVLGVFGVVALLEGFHILPAWLHALVLAIGLSVLAGAFWPQPKPAPVAQ